MHFTLSPRYSQIPAENCGFSIQHLHDTHTPVKNGFSEFRSVTKCGENVMKIKAVRTLSLHYAEILTCLSQQGIHRKCTPHTLFTSSLPAMTARWRARKWNVSKFISGSSCSSFLSLSIRRSDFSVWFALITVWYSSVVNTIQLHSADWLMPQEQSSLAALCLSMYCMW